MVLCYFCGSKGVHECCIEDRLFTCQDCEITTPTTTKQLTNDSNKQKIQQNQLEIKSNKFSDIPGSFKVLNPTIYLRRCNEKINSAIKLTKNIKRKMAHIESETHDRKRSRLS